MLWFVFPLYAAIFLFVFNISRVTSWYRTHRWIKGNPAFTFFLPLGLALLLSVVDSVRMYFAYRLALFLLGALGVYWLASQLSRRNKW